MATVTVLSIDRMKAIEAKTVVSATIVDGFLILTRNNGETINAGAVGGTGGGIPALQSPDGTKYTLAVDNNGVLSTVVVV